MDASEQAVHTYQEILKKVESGAENYHLLNESRSRFQLGKILMKMRKWEAAKAQFRQTLPLAGPEGEEKIFSHLHLGRILELQSKFPEAASHYRKSLELADVRDAHQEARESLERIANRG